MVIGSVAGGYTSPSGMTWIYAALTVLWLWLTWRDLRALAALLRLPPYCSGPPPEVTVVIAVRDDERQVRTNVPALLAQQGVQLRVVAVDDRSRDGTGEVLAALAAADPRLRVVTVCELPSGWLGKTHALHVGALVADSEWLLFSDGDARLQPDALRRTIDAAAAAGADHAVLLPSHAGTTFLGRACLLAFHQVVMRHVFGANAEPQRAHVGTGAFNLVRSAAYRRIGGHLPLRMEVVDDVMLARLLFRAGHRTRVFFAPAELTIDWGGTPLQLLAVVEKNMFAVLRFRTWLAAVALLAIALLVGLSLAGPFFGGTAGVAALASYLLTALPAMRFADRMGWSMRCGMLVPFTRLWLAVALARSTAVTLWRGGVRWRDTFYPLADLRRGSVL